MDVEWRLQPVSFLGEAFSVPSDQVPKESLKRVKRIIYHSHTTDTIPLRYRLINLTKEMGKSR